MTLRGKAKNAPIQTVISDKPTELPSMPDELKEDKRRARRTTKAASSSAAAAKIVVKATSYINNFDVGSTATATAVSAAKKSSSEIQKPNIILHLKCFLKDLTEHENQIHDEYKYNPDVPPEIVAYDKNESSYTFLSEAAAVDATIQKDTKDVTSFGTAIDDSGMSTAAVAVTNDDEFLRPVSESCIVSTSNDTSSCYHAPMQQPSESQINAKLKKLKLALFKNALDDKKSACFWCSYDFENPACYIPKYEFDRTIHAYGSFCTPECAAGYLFREDIDDSVKFERFHLLNQIYGEVFDYEKNIKPAPNPHYLLSKYYGNMSIEEYRALSRSEKTFLVIDRPMTRILPELHEEKDKMVSTGVYRVKRQSDVVSNKQSKNAILKEAFGLT